MRLGRVKGPFFGVGGFGGIGGVGGLGDVGVVDKEREARGAARALGLGGVVLLVKGPFLTILVVL